MSSHFSFLGSPSPQYRINKISVQEIKSSGMQPFGGQEGNNSEEINCTMLPCFGFVVFPTFSHSHKNLVHSLKAPDLLRVWEITFCLLVKCIFSISVLVSCYIEYMRILWHMHWVIPPAIQIIWGLVSNDGIWTIFLKELLMHSWVHTISGFNCPQCAARLSLRRLQSAGGATFISYPLPRPSPCQL